MSDLMNELLTVRGVLSVLSLMVSTGVLIQSWFWERRMKRQRAEWCAEWKRKEEAA